MCKEVQFALCRGGCCGEQGQCRQNDMSDILVHGVEWFLAFHNLERLGVCAVGGTNHIDAGGKVGQRCRAVGVATGG